LINLSNASTSTSCKMFLPSKWREENCKLANGPMWETLLVSGSKDRLLINMGSMCLFTSMAGTTDGINGFQQALRELCLFERILFN
jgi:hypothetical protein